MGTVPNDKSAGEKLNASEANDLRDIGYNVSLLAGENITGPQAVYLKSSDSKLYKCDGNDQDKLEFIGFVINSPTTGTASQLQMSGIVGGFSSLTAGAKYYVQDDGTVGTSQGTYEVLVGRAISTTEILIEKGHDEYMGSSAFSDSSGALSQVVAIPTLARKMIVRITAGGDDNTSSSSGTGEVVLYRNSISSLTYTLAQRASGAFKSNDTTFSISGSNLTITASSDWSPNNSMSGTVYFYR